MISLSLGQYHAGTSFIHRLDARIKVCLSFIFMIVIFCFTKAVPILSFALLLGICLVISRISIRSVLRSLKSVMILSILAFVFNLFSGSGPILFSIGRVHIYQDGLILGLLMSLRLCLLVLSTALFLTHTTSVLVLAEALEDLMRPLTRIKFPAHEIAMMMSIALRFIPTIAAEADKIMKAQSSRGANYDDGNLISRCKGMVTILVPLFVTSIRRANDLALAMEARCYSGGEGRTRMREFHIVASDWIFFFVTLAIMIVLLVLQYR
ncbi:MAG: energy-coupling factor transporter transmembrane component T [Eubacteriales bacterium]|nr:energy-coupling factor transporter transmembrane component T [Eubacteriales bacterium]